MKGAQPQKKSTTTLPISRHMTMMDGRSSSGSHTKHRRFLHRNDESINKSFMSIVRLNLMGRFDRYSKRRILHSKKKIRKKIVKLRIHLSYIVLNTFHFHFDETFHYKYKIENSNLLSKNNQCKIRESLFTFRLYSAEHLSL